MVKFEKFFTGLVLFSNISEFRPVLCFLSICSLTNGSFPTVLLKPCLDGVARLSYVRGVKKSAVLIH